MKLNAAAFGLRQYCVQQFHQTRAVVVDVGTAVTVDLVSPKGAFEGGAIFPGFRLMAKALHDFVPGVI